MPMNRWSTYESPIGRLSMACDAEGTHLVGLWMEGQKHFPTALLDAARPDDEAPVFGLVRDWLDRYFAGERPAIARIPRAPEGSAFRRQVWDLLCEIPSGSVTTYGAIARRLADARGVPSVSAQAVGGAVGHNPISIIVPCHRVVGASGSLTGYAGGIDRKIALLRLEGAAVEALSVPTRGTAL